ncbi:uncharacterized protein [Solanum lycopersicum]|uniref:uncharacterized protein n=1 Tax=Solanum lycopersicum TaxID=4081 RepID=UPI0002BCA160|nr:uncharacterized protein LOC101256884 [Solanum lycopersicum]
MGVSTTEKAELDAYQPKGVAQTWYNQWKDSRALGGGPITWEIFKKAFLDRFFPRKQREDKSDEFINLHQEGMSVNQYRIKFIKLSKYTFSIVSNARDEMICYVMRVFEELEKECRATMRYENMDLPRFMVHAQQIEESRLRKRNREAKKARSFESGSSKSRFDTQDKPKFNKRLSNQVSSNLFKTHNDRVSNPKPQKGRNVDPPRERPTCGMCGKKHVGEYLVGTKSCYGCVIGYHMVEDFPNVRNQVKGNIQDLSRVPSSEAPKMKNF